MAVYQISVTMDDSTSQISRIIDVGRSLEIILGKLTLQSGHGEERPAHGHIRHQVRSWDYTLSLLSPVFLL